MRQCGPHAAGRAEIPARRGSSQREGRPRNRRLLPHTPRSRRSRTCVPAPPASPSPCTLLCAPETLPAPCVRFSDRPGAQQRLVQEVLVIMARGEFPTSVAAVWGIELAPAHHLLAPLTWDLREYVDPGAHVLAALGVVRGGREHRVRPALDALGVQTVKLGTETPKRSGSPPTSFREISRL